LFPRGYLIRIPTDIQKDIESLVPRILGKPQDEVRHTLEMVLRAYDPCISCSTNLLEVTFK